MTKTFMLRTAMALLVLQPAVAEIGNLKPLWQVRETNRYRDGLREEIGFSFSYAGKKIGPAAPAGWKISSSGDAVIFRDASGLTVIRTARQFPEFNAIEYTIKFKNEGTSTLPVLSAVNAMDLTIAQPVAMGSSVVSSGGGAAEAVYPPKDFALKRTYFTPMTPIERGAVTLTTSEGNSSRDNLPFFFIEDQTKSEGLFASLGWTGDWKISIQLSPKAGTLQMTGGMNGVNLRLQPGEEISGPLVLIGSYRGPLSTGSNLLRRLILNKYQPTVAGKRLVPPILFTTWFDVGAELDEKIFRSLVDGAAAIGQEVFLQDAGWYEGVGFTPYTDMRATWKNISNPLGSWELGEDRRHFPNGLRPLADYVRSKGMVFGLWFEPERSGPHSLMVQKHPDWVTFLPNHDWGLVDFGNPGVQEYYCQILDRYIKEFGVRYLRWDQNNNLLPYWDHRDSPDRKGISQIRHVEGLHRVEDWVREHHPDVIFESCASGGQRVDLQTLQRRHTFWVSDETMDPLIARFHLEGANLFLPGNGMMVGFTPPTSTYQKSGFRFDDIAFQSYFGGAFGTAGRLFEWPPELKQQARKQFDAYKKIRGYLAGDYYALLPQPQTLEAWAGWQFHEDRNGEGFAQVFRMHSPEANKRIALHALEQDAAYELTDIYTGETWHARGSELTKSGFDFRLSEMSSRVLLYRKQR